MAEQSVTGNIRQLGADERAFNGGNTPGSAASPDFYIDWDQLAHPFGLVVTPDAEIDRAQNPLRLGASGHKLQPLLNPRSVVVVGAKDEPGTVAGAVIKNLQGSFPGRYYLVNPNRAEVAGVRTYRSVADVHHPEGAIDLAIIMTAPERVPGAMRQCGEAGVRAAIVISAGFKEVGSKGQALEREMLAIAREHGIRVLGPNCLGAMRPAACFNATFAAEMAHPGRIAFVSQSGALITGMLGWSLKFKYGFSALVSTGSMSDVSWGDLIEYFGEDSETGAIVIYMESPGEDVRSALSAMRKVAPKKPIIVIAPGRTNEAAKAAKSHTGALAGADDVLDAALHQCGVVRVYRIGELNETAEALAKQPLPQGSSLTVITNAGGPGVLSVDALILSGGKLTVLSQGTIAKLDAILPPTWPKRNPVDVIGDASAERVANALRVVMDDPNSNGILLILTPQEMTDPTTTARKIVEVLSAADASRKVPIFASFMGGSEMDEGKEILRAAGVAVFDCPDDAARTFGMMCKRRESLEQLYAMPTGHFTPVDPAAAQKVEEYLETFRASGRTQLTAIESQKVLEMCGMPVAPAFLATNPDEAAAIAQKIGFPVVLKLNSTTVLHKSDAGGVHLNLQNVQAVREAFETIRSQVAAAHGDAAFEGVSVHPMIRIKGGRELILGSYTDPQFGPVVLFGEGGTLVEVRHDTALAIPPLDTTLARLLVERTRIAKALGPYRGLPEVDKEALFEEVARFSHIQSQHPRIAEIDMNPFVVSGDQMVALDARVILHDWVKVPDERLLRPAIRPYPREYMYSCITKSGVPLQIRPILPADERLFPPFHETLEQESVYGRYFATLSPSMLNERAKLIPMCHSNFEDDMVLVACGRAPWSGLAPAIYGVASVSKINGTGTGEFAVLVSDKCQHQSVGTELLRRMIEVARQEGLTELTGEVLQSNKRMLGLCRKLGFVLDEPRDGSFRAHMALPRGV